MDIPGLAEDFKKISEGNVKTIYKTAKKYGLLPSFQFPNIFNISALLNINYYKLFVNAVFSVYLICTLQAAKYITLSIFEYYEGEEFDTEDHYTFSLMFFAVWLVCIVVSFLLSALIYMLVMRSFFMIKWPLMKYVSDFYERIFVNFDPNRSLLFAGFGVLILVNLVMMVYYIVTKDNDRIVFDKAEELHDTDADDEDIGYDRVENDKDGVGYVYRLVEIITTINSSLLVFLVFVIDWLR